MNNIFARFPNKFTAYKTLFAMCMMVLFCLIWQGLSEIKILKMHSLITVSLANTTMTPIAPEASAHTPTTPPPPPAAAPQPATLSNNSTPVSPQDEPESKYIAALNELQMLKITRELSEVNQAIITSKVATVQAEKNLLALLKLNMIAGSDNDSAQFNNSTTSPQPVPNIHPLTTLDESEYKVISIAQLRHKWNAILDYQGKLYNVAIGDKMPSSQFRIIAINQSGVTILQNGLRKHIPIVSII